MTTTANWCACVGLTPHPLTLTLTTIELKNTTDWGWVGFNAKVVKVRKSLKSDRVGLLQDVTLVTYDLRHYYYALRALELSRIHSSFA